MARIRQLGTETQVWLSATDTHNWATRPGKRWPCSQLSGHRLFASFDNRNGDLLDMTIDGKYGDCDGTEFNAITSDFIAERFPGHPAIRA